MDEVGSSIEVQAQVVFLMIFSRDIESVGDVLLGVADVYIFASSEKRGNIVFWVIRGILLSVCRFSAASRLPMKMAP